MRIRNRIKFMIAVENRYYNRQGALSFLIGLTSALLVFNIALNAFFLYGSEPSKVNQEFFRYSIYLLLVFLVLYILYRLALRYLGIQYSLTMFFTSACFFINLFSGYMLFRAAGNWGLNYLIDSPIGFTPILNRALNEALLYCYFAVIPFFILSSLIPIKRQRPLFFGRLWMINVLLPLINLATLIFIIVFQSEKARVASARLVSVIFFTAMLFMTVRYFHKAVLYLILPLIEKFRQRDVSIEDLPQRTAKKVRETEPDVKTQPLEQIPLSKEPVKSKASSPSGKESLKKTEPVPAAAKNKKPPKAAPTPKEVFPQKKKKPALLSFSFEVLSVEESDKPKKTKKAAKPKPVASLPVKTVEKPQPQPVEQPLLPVPINPVPAPPLEQHSFKIEPLK